MSTSFWRQAFPCQELVLGSEAVSLCLGHPAQTGAVLAKMVCQRCLQQIGSVRSPACRHRLAVLLICKGDGKYRRWKVQVSFQHTYYLSADFPYLEES